MPVDQRHPWRTRAKLLAFVDAVAGVFASLGVLALVLGVIGDIDAWVSGVGVFVSGAVGFIAWLANIGIVKDGEAQTTPVADPLGPDLLPLLSIRTWDALNEAAAHDDIHTIRQLLGQHLPHE